MLYKLGETLTYISIESNGYRNFQLSTFLRYVSKALGMKLSFYHLVLHKVIETERHTERFVYVQQVGHFSCISLKSYK